MKKVLVLLTLVAAVSAYSQGTVNFVNRNTGVTPAINAPITYNAGGPMVAGRVSSDAALSVSLNGFTYGGANATAGLYGGAAGTAEDSLVLLVPAVGFRTGTAAGYLNPGSDSTRVVQGVLPGAAAVFQVRAWDAGITAGSFEAASAMVSASHGVYLGKSALVNVASLGGAGVPPGPPAELFGLEGFGMTYTIVPEPSIIGLGILGAIAGLMVFRRRS